MLCAIRSSIVKPHDNKEEKKSTRNNNIEGRKKKAEEGKILEKAITLNTFF